jgi:hypothetical protein
MTRLHEQVEPWWRISTETERVVPGPFRDFIRYYGSWNASDPPDPDCPAVEGLHSPKDYFAVLAVLNDTATWFLFSTTGGYGGYPDVLEAALASPEQLKVWVTG